MGELVDGHDDETELIVHFEDAMAIRFNGKSEEGLGEFVKLAYKGTVGSEKGIDVMEDMWSDMRRHFRNESPIDQYGIVNNSSRMANEY